MANISKMLSEHIDIWTAAESEKKSGRGRASANSGTVYGVKKLRELILELAVRGKLVPQDINDEPASELLKRIKAEKAKLISTGKLKQEKPISPITEDKKPFKLPNRWVWIRNCELFQLRKGRIPKSLNEDGLGLPYLDIDALDRNTIRRYSEELTCPQSTDKDILVVCDGSRSGLVLDGKNGIIGSTLSIIDTPIFIQNYIRLIFKQGFEIFNTSMKGAAIPHLDTQKLLQNPTALPPLAEQLRIVAKVDELMALCDKLEQQHSNAEEAHETLVSQLLATLTQSQNAAEFNANWQRIYAHFDALFTTEASIDALKKTLLQLAVMGKLVPQDINDEPASELLKRIQAKKIKTNLVWLDFIGLDELKKVIPSNWTWVRLGEIADIVRGGSPRPAGDLKFYDGNIPFLKVGDVTRSRGKMVEGFTSTIKPAGLIKTRFINTRTVLLTNSGATLGVPAICDFETTFNDGIAAFINLSSEMFDEYLYLYLKSISAWFLEVAAQGQGQPNLNTDIIRSTWIPVTSIAEQKRIVAKVDELMAMCDQLKTPIQQANQLKKAIADTFVSHSLMQ